ncbi:phage holin family protein [Herbiconiux daphne]|uniref:Phage holin family protein n=1 Tax=Herbiconiux daphne TaxID=2970914 RepID=A0ABT2HC92_9MICO|nr:phage holin family protein [Herbiconiux daphne]MCS5737552.1 phage holin family protein [Herbiconiux daphne]
MDRNLTHLWEFFHLYRNQLGYGLLAATVNALAHYKRKDSARDSFVDVLFCGAIGWGVDGFLRAHGMAPEGAVMAAAMIGYIGAQGISDLIRSKLGLGGNNGSAQNP